MFKSVIVEQTVPVLPDGPARTTDGGLAQLQVNAEKTTAYL
jgi:hypothetical protein